MEDIDYHPIGEVFEHQGRKIKAVVSSYRNGCSGCVFYRNRSLCDIVSEVCCLSSKRKDGLSVIYVSAEKG